MYTNVYVGINAVTKKNIKQVWTSFSFNVVLFVYHLK